jgi:periplasmic divalent cation tolerance protein
VAAWIAEHHTYETPEVLALGIEGGSEKYLAWVHAETAS